MKTGTRILAGITILLSTAVLLVCLVLGVGVWLMKDQVAERATKLFTRIEAALTSADKGLVRVQASLARAEERLKSVNEEQKKLAQQPAGKDNAVRMLLARSVQQKIAPELGEGHEAVQTVAEAAVVVNSVLEDLGNFPLLADSGLDVGDLKEINRNLTKVQSSAWELSRLLGETDPDAPGPKFSEVEEFLKTLLGLIAKYEPRLAEVRQRTALLKTQTLYWITLGSVLISIVCLWIALSQISLLVHAWSWWRRADHNAGAVGQVS